MFEWIIRAFAGLLGTVYYHGQCPGSPRQFLGRKNKVAFVWIGEDGSEVTVSYGQLLRRVNRAANALKSGSGSGDRVVIYMPLTIEGVTAMFVLASVRSTACACRVSALGRCAADEDAHAKVVMTSDVTYRRGRAVDLKSITDEAVGGLDHVEKVIVHRRQTPQVELRTARELDFNELVERVRVWSVPQR